MLNYTIGYIPDDYIRPYISVDVVLFRINEKHLSGRKKLPDTKLEVLMIKRKNTPGEPFPEYLSLPGGLAIEGKRLEETAKIKLFEKTGIKDFTIWEQLPAFSDPLRDIRNHVISIPFISIISKSDTIPENESANWIDIVEIREQCNIAFDHKLIIEAAFESIKSKLWKSDVVLNFLKEQFILSEAYTVYKLFGDEIARVNFKRDFSKLNIAENTHIKEENGKFSGAQAEFWKKKK